MLHFCLLNDCHRLVTCGLHASEQGIDFGEDMQSMTSDPFSANATSQLSPDFKSAVSTSPLETRLHHRSRLDRAHSESLLSTVMYG